MNSVRRPQQKNSFQFHSSIPQKPLKYRCYRVLSEDALLALCMLSLAMYPRCCGSNDLEKEKQSNSVCLGNLRWQAAGEADPEGEGGRRLHLRSSVEVDNLTPKGRVVRVSGQTAASSSAGEAQDTPFACLALKPMPSVLHTKQSVNDDDVLAKLPPPLLSSLLLSDSLLEQDTSYLKPSSFTFWNLILSDKRPEYVRCTSQPCSDAKNGRLWRLLLWDGRKASQPQHQCSSP
ncbi:hypothetical protein MG293_020187 [Ovis ammon polii]|uniref:Uncharacterized protein n=1 Tax=Ovis ammon polii TaxID=230172 RepID=A0AAD4XZI0_OVIAM|nr:hypothetical protein MG293_020187 [Ovis ammon polii]